MAIYNNILLIIEPLIRSIAEICHEKFFIDLDKETVLSRRVHRNYIPADPPGYFEQWVWPMYVKNKEELKDQKDISELLIT